MPLSFNSISERALSELPASSVESDLEIELFGENSFAFNLPTDSVSLILSYANDEVYPVYYGGNKDAWIVPLETAASDQIQQIFKFVETASLEISSTVETSTVLNSIETATNILDITENIEARYEIPADTISLELTLTSIERPSWLISDPAIFSIDGEYFHNLKLFSTETGSLTIDIVDFSLTEDTPDEDWRGRAGLPLGPLSFNAIGVEQSIGPLAKTYPDESTAELVFGLTEITSSTVSRIESGLLVINDDDRVSVANNIVDSGNLTTISISDQIVFLNSSETGQLEVAAFDQIKQSFNFVEVASLEIEATESVSSTLTYEDILYKEIIVDFLTSSSQNYYNTLTNEIGALGLESKLSDYNTSLTLVAEPNDLISIRYYDFSSAPLEIDFKTFAKEYTFLQQVTAIDITGFSINIESTESFGITAKPKQIWFG